ncbi:hypothetical protein M426DRAFT_28213 [Hypoxylon sp. CI-4A]|nr:hypothetical protein M426DRAFT_28213 [Hypoxylon sp. CI-4A]
MNTYYSSPLPQGPYNPPPDANLSSRINTLIVASNFVDSLAGEAPFSGNANLATPDFKSFNFPTRQPFNSTDNGLAPPLVVSWKDNSPDEHKLRHILQWQYLWRFVRKIRDYYQKLQGCKDQGISSTLKSWLTAHPQAETIRTTGLLALRDILQNSITSQFEELLCAMVVQHAISQCTCEVNPFEANMRSAFSGWRDSIPLNQGNQGDLDTVFSQLKLVDESSLEGAEPTRPAQGTFVFETGSIFSDTNSNSYPTTINDNSCLPLGPDYNASEYAPNYPPSQPTLFGPAASSGPEYFPSYSPPNANSPFPSNELHNSSASLRQPSPSNQGFSFIYPPTYHTQEVQFGAISLIESPSFETFRKYVDNFSDQGDLSDLFSHGPINWNNAPLNSNTRLSNTLFCTRTESAFFAPLRTLASQSPNGSIQKAIVSSAQSLTLLGGLQSLEAAAEYMIHLSKNLLPDPQSCRSFARRVLQKYHTALIADESSRSGSRGMPGMQQIERKLDIIVKDYCGIYYPAYFLAPQATPSHDARTQTLSRQQSSVPSGSDSSLLQPSIFDRPRSYAPSIPDSATETSTVYERTINTSSSADDAFKCSVCDKLYTGRNAKTSLCRHKRNHKDLTISCPGCGKKYKGTRTDNIRQHCAKEHPNITIPKSNTRAYWAQYISSSPELQGN